MKLRYITLSLMMLFATASLIAQPREGKERLQSAKIAFITSKLDLSPNEAQVFWPVYNEYQEKERLVREEIRNTVFMSREHDYSLSDKEYEKLISDALATKQKQLDLESEYMNRLLTVISPRKVAILMKSEREFGMRLLRSLNGRRVDSDSPPRERR